MPFYPPRSAGCDAGCEYRWSLRHGWQLARNMECRYHAGHVIHDLPAPVTFSDARQRMDARGMRMSRENLDAIMGRFHPGEPIPDPMNDPTLADLYPIDVPWSHVRRVRGGYTVTHEGSDAEPLPWSSPDADVIGDIRRVHDEARTPGEIIREYGRLNEAGEIIHEDDAARESGVWGQYPAQMREHMQRLRDMVNVGIVDSQEDIEAIERAVRRQVLGIDGVGGLTPDRVIVDDDAREWETIDPRRRRAIANWVMTDRGRSGLLGKGDYPPEALTRNPPGFWTPEAHP